MFGVYGQVWIKNDAGDWDRIKSGSEDGQALLANLDIKPIPSTTQSREELSSGAVAALSIISTLFLGVIIVVIVFLGRRVFKNRKRMKSHSNYVTINDSADGEGSNSMNNPTPNTSEPV